MPPVIPQPRNRSVSSPSDRDVFQALADPTRRAILEVLRRPAISKHLRILKEADLVKEVKVGRNRLYELHPEPLRDIDEWLAHYRHMWQHQLRNLKRYVERKGKEH